MSNDKGKQAAGYQAAMLIQSGMKVGLGTGSTAFYFIEKLIERCQKGLKIKAIATSKASSEQAKNGGIELIDPMHFDALDLDVDGADEIDSELQMIKGGGGALFREKIIAHSAKKMVVVVDYTKCVQKLGRHPLPVELLPFGLQSTLKCIDALGLKGELRKKESQLYLTDNGNYIFDAHLTHFTSSFKELDLKLHAIPGVVETGFFWNLAKKVYVGYPDGRVEEKGDL